MEFQSIPSVVMEVVADVVKNALGIDLQPGREEPLLSSGLIDSVSLLDLLERLSARAGFVVDPMEVTLENFDTVARIEAFTELKLKGERK